MRLKIFIMTYLLLQLSVPCENVFGQDEVVSLSLSDVIKRALDQNHTLNQYANQVKISEITYRQSKQNLLPDLQASVSATQRFDRQYNELSGTTSGNDSRSMNAAVQSGVNLFNGFGSRVNIEKSKSDLSVTELNYQREKETIIYQTISGFLDVIQNAEVIEIEKSNLAAQQNQLNRIQEFYDTGNRPISDVLQQRADIADAELRLLNAENQYEISRLNLLDILGEIPDRSYKFIAPDSVLIAEIVRKSAGDTFNFESRADWRAEKYKLKGTELQIDEAKSGYWPSLNLNLSAGSSYNSGRYGLDFIDQFNDVNPYATAGLNISIPLFDRFSTKNSIETARIKNNSEVLELEKLRLAIQLDTRQARFDYETALKQRAAANAKLDYARQSLEVTEARYNVGSSTYVELSQIRASYLSAANEHVQAVYNHLLKRVALSYNYGTIGTLLSDLKILE